MGGIFGKISDCDRLLVSGSGAFLCLLWFRRPRRELEDVASSASQTVSSKPLGAEDRNRGSQQSVLPKSGHQLNSRDLLELAGLPGTIGRTPRLPSGCLQDWPTWAELQPQRSVPVDVLGADSSMRGAAGQISLVSWNTLSKTWLSLCERDKEYAHVHQQWLDWGTRSEAIINWLSRLAADLIVLQEVDFSTFEEAFQLPLAKLGYEALMQDNPKRTDAQPCGNATFWRRDKFELMWSEHRSRTLLTGFKIKAVKANNTLTVINAHLESSQEKFSGRAAQVHSALEKAGRHDPGASTILVGDFNTGADSQLCKVLREYEWHGFAMASAYEHPDAESTSPVVDATFRANGHSYLIDHLWYGHGQLQLCKVLQPLNAEARSISLGPNASGLPDRNVPSDHIPIGAVFEMKEFVTSVPESCFRAKSTKELWASSQNVLTSQQQEVWHALMLQSQQQPKCKGKPSPEELVVLRAAAAERKKLEQTLQAGLGDEGREFVRQMRALHQQAQSIVK